MNESLTSTLKKLRLSGLAETLEVRLHEAGGNHLTHAEFLELILQDEMLVREERQIAQTHQGSSLSRPEELGRFRLEFQSIDQEKRDL